MELNIGVGKLLSQTFSDVGAMSTKLSENMAASQGTLKEDPSALLDLQFQLGQYNTMVELSSSISKNLVDSLKSICQKI